jgi:hypothetical protein
VESAVRSRAESALKVLSNDTNGGSKVVSLDPS